MAKTLRSRIAAVAVAAMGISFVQVTAASAAEHPAASTTVGTITATQPSGRTGVQVDLSSTITMAFTAGDESSTTVDIATAFVSKPAGSEATVAQTLSESSSNLSENDDKFTISADITANETGTASATFTPDVVGSYTVAIWHDRDGGADIDTGESVKSITITVVAGTDAVTVGTSIINSTTSTDATGNGSLVKISIKTSSGAVASLGSLETLKVTAGGSAKVYKVNETTENAASVVLNRSSFDRKGVAFLNVTNGTAETVTLTVAGNTGSALSAVSNVNNITFVDETTTGTVGPLSFTNTSGVYEATAATASVDGAWKTKSDTSTSVTFSGTSSAVSLKHLFTVTDTSAVLTGYLGTTARKYDIVATADTATTPKVSFSITAALALGESYDVEWSETGAGGGDKITVAGQDAASASASVEPTSSIRTVVGATISLGAVVKNQFAEVYANAPVAVSVAGRNASTSNTNLVTDANGRVTFTLTDLSASTTSLTDTVTFDIPAGTDPTVTVTYATSLGVSSITLAYPGDADTVAGTTTTDIAAGALGATGASASVSATVKDANGTALAYVPVTFTVAGLTGAEVHTTKVTVYTDATGSASSNISSYAAGKATFTATAGGVSKSGDIYFKQADATDARTVEATVAGRVITAVVKDRYGNTIEGVSLNAVATGNAFFGTGTNTASGTTDKTGVVKFVLLEGNGATTVTVQFTSSTYGQTADAAGKVGSTAVTAYTAGTTTANQKGLGSSLAPVGVNSVAVAVAAAVVDTSAIDAIKAQVATLGTTITSIQTAISTLVASTTATLTLIQSQIAKIMKKLKI